MKTVRILLAVGVVAGLVLVVTLLTVVVTAAERWPWWLVLLGVAVVAVLVAARLRKWIRRGTVLEIDLDGGVVETTGPNPVARALNRKAVAVRDVVDALHRAADDPRISGLVVRLGNGAIDVGHAQELRDAVAHFRGAGKTTIAFAEVFGRPAMPPSTTTWPLPSSASTSSRSAACPFRDGSPGPRSSAAPWTSWESSPTSTTARSTSRPSTCSPRRR